MKNLSLNRENKLNKGNIERMQQGKAPKGLNGKSVNLHHTFGREGKFFNVYEELTRTEHYAHFKSYILGCIKNRKSDVWKK